MDPSAPSASVIPIDPLRLWIEPANGDDPYEADLREFAIGGSAERIPERSRAGWAGNFSGRPKLAGEFAEMVRVTRPSEDRLTATRWAMRHLYRFLDETPDATEVDSAAAFTDGHGPAFKHWLGQRSAGAYRSAKTALDRMRELQGLPRLFWPARAHDVASATETVDRAGMRRLYRALKSEAKSIKGMFAEGQRLADRGRDPRGQRRIPGSAAWHRRENHAWLVRELTCERLIDRKELLADGGQGLIKANDPDTEKHDGPEYLVPSMTERGREGMVGKLRWFHPSYHDTAIFLWLFLVGTGWNLSTALAVDVSVDVSGNETWLQRHPHKDDYVVIHAFKGRADRHQLALSMERPEWHPYRIVQFMVERTRPLRATLRYRLEQIREKHRRAPSRKSEQRIAALEASLRSPWLYHVVNKTGEVGSFHNEDAGRLNEIVRGVVGKHGLLDEHPSLAEMMTSVARDAWIGYAYVQSGYHVMMTKLAAQQANARMLKYYLRQRRYRDHSEDQVRTFHEAVFGELRAGRAVDPTRLRLLVRNGEITEDQERRLLDLRQRTRLGMGCLDPTRPPREIAPGHRDGMVCRVQRCTGCRHGVVFAESLVPLARACAELIFIKRSIPLTAWTGSSFEDELASLEETLLQFDAATVEAEITVWLGKLKSGDVFPHDTYPGY
ncbi:MAG: hypothetical protein K2Y27_21115 [Xanthobacteraceae bacterium]|nr:hypothetical protein [Xanthobacteraceae bacterium]